MDRGLQLLHRVAPFIRLGQPDGARRPPAGAQARSKRDLRIDMLRGLALITIFIDHIADNPLNRITMRNFGFSDAAELFVILAGISSMLAYGKYLQSDGFIAGSLRVIHRCLRIYACQILLVVVTLVTVQQWWVHFGRDPGDLAPFFERPAEAFARALVLHAQPGNVNILPLYLVLLGLFPLIYLGLRHARGLTLAGSAAVWLAANLLGGLNLTNWIGGQEWFFNPFAWQFLFTLGAFTAITLREHGGELPRLPLLTLASWSYLIAAFVLAAPWASWGLADFRLIEFGAPDKTDLSLFRLIDVLAVIYLALGSARLRRLAARAWAAPLVICGKHSLEVFTLGTVLAFVSSLMLRSFGPSWWLVAVANLAGIAAMLAFAQYLEHRRLAAGQSGWQPGRGHAVAGH